MFDVYLDKLEELILVEIQDEIMNEIESIANNNQGKLVRQSRFLQEILYLLRVVVITLATDPFDFGELTTSTGGLDVLEMYVGVGGEIDDTTEVVVQSLEGFELFKEFDELGGTKEIRVFRGDLDDHLEILTDVGGQHFLEADETLLDAEAAEVSDEPFGVQVFGTYDDALDIFDVFVVFQSLHVTSLTITWKVPAGRALLSRRVERFEHGRNGKTFRFREWHQRLVVH